MSDLILTAVGGVIALVLIVTVLTSLAKAGRAHQDAARKEAEPRQSTRSRSGPARPQASPRAPQAQSPAEDQGEAFPPLDIEDKVKRKVSKKMDEIVTEHPDEALSLLRRWMHGNNHAD